MYIKFKKWILYNRKLLVYIKNCIYFSAKVLAVLHNNGSKYTRNHHPHSVSVVYGHSVMYLRHACHEYTTFMLPSSN